MRVRKRERERCRTEALQRRQLLLLEAGKALRAVVDTAQGMGEGREEEEEEVALAFTVSKTSCKTKILTTRRTLVSVSAVA